jgi:hypothetical protein
LLGQPDTMGFGETWLKAKRWWKFFLNKIRINTAWNQLKIFRPFLMKE